MKMNRSEDAVSLFKKGYNCSQSVFCTLGVGSGLNDMMALKIGAGFGGGIGHLGETCGAVTGAIMAIGLKHGLSIPDRPSASNSKVYDLVNKFVNAFKERNKSIECSKLLGCDISDPNQYLAAREKGLFLSICPKYVSDAIEIAEKIIVA
jgi:C_GCAxxG_C_C family probable redox protein